MAGRTVCRRLARVSRTTSRSLARSPHTPPTSPSGRSDRCGREDRCRRSDQALTSIRHRARIQQIRDDLLRLAIHSSFGCHRKSPPPQRHRPPYRLDQDFRWQTKEFYEWLAQRVKNDGLWLNDKNAVVGVSYITPRMQKKAKVKPLKLPKAKGESLIRPADTR